jgi:hypothetical protein
MQQQAWRGRTATADLSHRITTVIDDRSERPVSIPRYCRAREITRGLPEGRVGLEPTTKGYERPRV